MNGNASADDTLEFTVRVQPPRQDQRWRATIVGPEPGETLEFERFEAFLKYLEWLAWGRPRLR